MFKTFSLAMLISTAGCLSAARAEIPMNCRGNACNDVDITFAGNGYNAENIGDRRINFTLEGGGIMRCPAYTVSARLLPGRTRLMNAQGYCGAIANYE